MAVSDRCTRASATPSSFALDVARDVRAGSVMHAHGAVVEHSGSELAIEICTQQQHVLRSRRAGFREV